MNRALSTLAAGVVAAAALGTSSAALAATPKTSSPPTTDPAKGAAGWLARQLTGAHADHYLYPGTSFAADGPTADGILAMDAAKVAQTAAARATAWLQSDASNYAFFNGYYPGALGKLGLVAEAQGISPTTFGGIDIPQQIQASENTDTTAGNTFLGAYENANDPEYDSSSATDQSLAILALVGTGVSADRPDANAITWLETRQCADGGFADDPTTTPGATCDEPDTAGYAAQALFALGAADATAHADAVKAAAWLVNNENSDGGWGSPSDSNDTALAVQGLLADGDTASTAAAAKGIAFLKKLQLGPTAASAQRGGVKLHSADTTANLIATTQSDQALARGVLGGITKTGAAAAAPILAVPVVVTPKPTPSPSTTRSATGTGTSTASGSTLPMTGAAHTSAETLIAVWLLCAGITTVLLTRRRVH